MNLETKGQSVFMQMHDGTRSGEGSFNVALQDLFYKADQSNRRKLVTAFPEFFGDEVPEFGIMAYTPKKCQFTDCPFFGGRNRNVIYNDDEIPCRYYNIKDIECA